MFAAELAPNVESSIENSHSKPVCEVIRTHDRFLVSRTFASMNPQARAFLWNWLEFGNQYEPGEIPEQTTPTGAEFLWHELLRAAREADGSFFIVNEHQRGEVHQIFVSADLIGAQCYACQRMGERFAVELVHKCRSTRHARSNPVRFECQFERESTASSVAAASRVEHL